MNRETDDKVFEAYMNTVLERKFDLGSGHMGNGISVWNRAKEVHGDYEKIAHIDTNRKIKYYIKNPPKEVKDYVEKIAKGKNPNISATQSQKVFKEDTDINEASQINFEELPPDKQKLVKDVFKGTTYDISKQVAFDGIHGQIVMFKDQFGGPSVRLNKKSLQRIIKDKNVRWVDVSAIGF